MKAKTLSILGICLMLTLMAVPVLALAPVSVTSSDPVGATQPLTAAHRTEVTPTINITPLLVSSQQAMGTIVTQTLTISNPGSGDLVWQIVESAAARPARPSVPAAMEVIQDGGFEDGAPNSYWEEYSRYAGTPLCMVGFCNGTPHSGNWWAWFGGADYTEAGSAYLSQTVIITPGLATLGFWIKLTEQALSEHGEGNFTVTLDSTIIFTANQTMTSTYANYTLVTRDVTAFADGQAHVLNLAESDSDAPGFFDLHVDDVSLTVIDCVPSNLPWLTVTPDSGTTGAGGSSVVNVVFNSVGRVGTYTGTLCIISNDPIADVIRVPVTLKSIAVFLPLIRR